MYAYLLRQLLAVTCYLLRKMRVTCWPFCGASTGPISGDFRHKLGRRSSRSGGTRLPGSSDDETHAERGELAAAPKVRSKKNQFPKIYILGFWCRCFHCFLLELIVRVDPRSLSSLSAEDLHSIQRRKSPATPPSLNEQMSAAQKGLLIVSAGSAVGITVLLVTSAFDKFGPTYTRAPIQSPVPAAPTPPFDSGAASDPRN